VKRAALFIRLNDLVVTDNYIQPIISRTRVAALGGKLTAHISGWDLPRQRDCSYGKTGKHGGDGNADMNCEYYGAS
jgi:hypothetical protein